MKKLERNDLKNMKNNFTENARKYMLEKSQTYNPDQRVYQFGFYDGFNHAKKEDHSEEMLSVLSEVMRFKHELRMIMSEKLQYPDNFLKALNDSEQLLNKVKDNASGDK